MGSEGNPNPEVWCYVVIACDRDGEPWEVGMIITRTEFGSDGKEQKYSRAQRLFERISRLVLTA